MKAVIIEEQSGTYSNAWKALLDDATASDEPDVVYCGEVTVEFCGEMIYKAANGTSEYDAVQNAYKLVLDEIQAVIYSAREHYNVTHGAGTGDIA